MAAPGKIDPSFSGHLRVYIFNGGRADVVITPGEVIASVAFFNIETPYDGKAVGTGFPSISPPPSFFGRFVLRAKRMPRWAWAAAGAFFAGAAFIVRSFL